MAIHNRSLEIGTKLVARYKKVEYHAEVVAGENGKVRYKLDDGSGSLSFKTPSGAGQHIRGGKATNGWAFWSLAGAATTMAPATPTVGTEGPADVADEESPVQATKPPRKASTGHPAPKPKGRGRNWRKGLKVID